MGQAKARRGYRSPCLELGPPFRPLRPFRLCYFPRSRFQKNPKRLFIVAQFPIIALTSTQGNDSILQGCPKQRIVSQHDFESVESNCQND